MLKKYRKTLIVASILTLLPVLAGVILWNRLPEQMPIHFNSAGEVDGYASRAFAVFAMPLILVGFEWLCALGGFKMDPKAYNLDSKVMSLVLWFIPVLSVFLHVLVYGSALGMEMDVQLIMPIFIGLAMVVIGNWLPKCKPTWTLGIKLPWTLENEENWIRTHRFAGPVWVACGLLIVLFGFLGDAWQWGMVAAFAVMILVPAAYSFLFFKGVIK